MNYEKKRANSFIGGPNGEPLSPTYENQDNHAHLTLITHTH